MKRWLLLILLLASCAKEKPQLDLSDILNSAVPELQRVTQNIDAHEVQIMLTDLKTGREYHFQVNDSNYFYPASTVKLPVAILALEKAYEDAQVSSSTAFYIEGDSTVTTIRKEVEKIFAVSDNEAYNRLFESLGTDYINRKLQEKGLQPGRIAHRLSIPEADDPTTRTLVFQLNDSTLVQQEEMVNRLPERLQLNRVHKGVGYYDEDLLVHEPMDFSEKNYLPITTLHGIMKRLFATESFSKVQQFQLDEEDQSFLLSTMAKLPRELGYDQTEYYDSYVKFFMFGDSEAQMPSHIKIHNKVGYAYGYLTDCAYVIDNENDVEFILTATVHVNENQIFNDDTYEYEELGIPFLAALGREVHNKLSN